MKALEVTWDSLLAGLRYLADNWLKVYAALLTIYEALKLAGVL